MTRRSVYVPRPLALGLTATLLWVSACSDDPAGRTSLPVAGDGSPGLSIPEQRFDEAALAELGSALEAYEETRAALAADDLARAAVEASRLGSALDRVLSLLADPEPPTAGLLEEAARAAESAAGSPDLEQARRAFGEVSRFLLPVAAADDRLSGGWHVFRCPMTGGFGKWMQPTDELENPYMGRAMPGCGEEADWTVTAPDTLEEIEAHAEHAHGTEEGIAYYTCSMHPSVRSDAPGTCPICSMDLVPVTREEIATGVIRVDGEQRQTIGVTTERIERRPVVSRIRAVGTVLYDERRLADVTVKYRGWIGELHVDQPGQAVERHEPLFTLYSPELYAAQEELLTALASREAARETAAPERADYLVDAARQRLRLWDLREWQIAELERSGTPLEYVPILSPVSGHVMEKNVVAGASVEPGMRLYRIAGLDEVWVEAEVYESQLSLIEVGQPATVSLAYVPGRSFRGRVDFVYPYLDDASRTGRVRIELANPRLDLKPDMYAQVELQRDLGEQLVVPEDAVLYAGERRFVFLDLGEGRLQPRSIRVGVASGDHLVVLSGLEEGDLVVTSGNFLVAAEARLKLAMEHWR